MIKNNAVKKYSIIVLLFVLILFVLISSFLYLGNNWIEINIHNLRLNKLPIAFNDFKILQISDLHNKEFGKDNKILIKKIGIINPDIILITGDLIDCEKNDINIALKLISQINSIAPIYFVNGNHEWWSGKAQELENELNKKNIIILNNKKIVLSRDDSEIALIGIDDPEGFSDENEYLNKLEELKDDRFSILLAHRPENFDFYVNNFDIIFSGHAHGGQIRIPFIGGLVAPDQGFFPKFTSGIYEKDETKMLVSRGLGNSIIPIRIFNRPELLVVVLSSIDE